MRYLLRWTIASILLLGFIAFQGNSQQSAAAPGGFKFKRNDPTKTIDDYQSHFPLDVQPPQDLEAALKNRLALAKDLAKEMSQLKDLFKNQSKIDQEMINELLKKFPHDLESLKNLKQEAQQALKGGQIGGPGQSQQLEDLIQKIKNLPDANKGLQNLVTPQSNHPVDPPPTNGPGANPSPAPRKPSEQIADFITKKLSGAANYLEKNGYDEDGSALKEALRHLTSLSRGESSSFLQNVRGLVDRFEGVGRYFTPENLGLKDLPHIPRPNWKLTMPSLPSMDMPALSAPSLGGFPSVPSISTPEAPSLLVWCAVLLFLGLLAWKLPSWMRDDNKAEAMLRGNNLGPWPVAPNAVHTRGELIRAFEYLSLLILGPTARTGNHNDLAHRLGADLVDRQEAAQCLARLYEQSRYAPEQSQPETLLPEQDQVEARHALCLLAGVTAP